VVARKITAQMRQRKRPSGVPEEDGAGVCMGRGRGKERDGA